MQKLLCKADTLPLCFKLHVHVQVATGVSCLHERSIVHGDLKTSNLLIDRDGRNLTCVVTDFGLSVFVGDTLSSGALTVHISPPEVLFDPRAPRSQAGDVYAFGIVLLEIVVGRPAYRGTSRDAIREFVLKGRRPAIPVTVPEDIASLIQSCWAQDPSDRPSFADIVTALEQGEHQAENQEASDPTQTTTMTQISIHWPTAEP
jgi:serine/threonine protein kinase